MPEESRVELGEGYSLEITPELKAVVYNQKGKLLSSVPASVKKLPGWQRWLDLQQNHQQRLWDHEGIVVGWMVSGERLSGDVLCALWPDPAWRTKLRGLLLMGNDHPTSGMLMGAELERGLGIVTQELASTWVKGKWWHVPHLASFSDAEVEAWRACSVDSGIAAGVAQLTRQLYLPNDAELAERSSARFAGRTLPSAAYTSYAFNGRGWSTSNGVASRSYAVLRPDGDPLKITVRFEYFAGGDYGDWNSECTTGSLSFVGTEDQALRVREVPSRVFSEACTTINAIINRPGGNE